MEEKEQTASVEETFQEVLQATTVRQDGLDLEEMEKSLKRDKNLTMAKK